jgi:hypothetical protein
MIGELDGRVLAHQRRRAAAAGRLLCRRRGRQGKSASE